MANKGRGSSSDKSLSWDGNKWAEVDVTSGSLYHDTTHNPVALYQFDESLADTSGNSLTSFSVESGTERYTNILPGLKGFLFDGSTDIYVNAAEASLAITGDMTIEMILSAGEVASSLAIPVSYYATGETEITNLLYSIRLLASSANCLSWTHEQGAGVNETYDSNIGVPLGRPIHLAAVRSSNDVTFYVNGERFQSGSTGLNAPTGGSSSRLYAGGQPTASNAFTGAISSLKILNSALTSAQIRAEYNRTLGKVFGEQNLFSYRSAVFNGTDEYVTMGNVLGFERTDAFSLSCWIKTTDAGQVVFMGKMAGATAYPGYELYMDTSERLAFHIINNALANNTVRVRGSNTINDNTWKHICVTYDGSSSASGVSLYINGSQIATTTEQDGLTGSTLNSNNLCIGRRDGSASLYYAGNICEAAIHYKELSAIEVEWIYNEGQPQNLRGPGAPTNLVGWWPLGEDVSGTTALDKSTGGNNGTLTNMTAYANVLNDHPR
jgi:hypothetical protein